MASETGEPIRVALIGYGLAGQVFHAPLVSATPGMKLASVVTGDPGRQARATKENEGVRILPSVEPLWGLAAEHDLAVVATPNRFHVPLGLAALDAGLPVVIDKPMAATAQDGRRLLAAASERGLLLTVFHNRRWDGDFLTVRRLVSDGTLGSIIRFESRIERWRPEVQEGRWRERGGREEAGGLLFDLGSHLIDQAVVLFGPPERVYAEVDRRRPGANVDDDVFVALAHEGGVRSHLWMSFLASTPGPRMRVLGARGTYEKHGLDGQEEALRAGTRPDDGGWGREPEERWGRFTSGDDVRSIQTEPGAWPQFYRQVGEALRHGGAPPVPPGEAVGVLEVIEAALESAQRGVVTAPG
ncbi:MAG: Gfo/Idh/MocA family oxidoreductase [Actinomycetota bacterium]